MLKIALCFVFGNMVSLLRSFGVTVMNGDPLKIHLHITIMFYNSQILILYGLYGFILYSNVTRSLE